MSIEVGRSIFPVFVKNSTSGTPYEEIEGLKAEVLETAPEFTELVSALDEVMSNAQLHDGIVREMHEKGKYLLGISQYSGYSSRETLAGLFYAEVENQDEDGAFSVVRMGVWISAARIAEAERADLRRQFVDMSLSEAELAAWRQVPVPVSRLTRVTPLHSLESEQAEGYIYGHRKDLEAIGRLAVPEALRQELAATVDNWHSANSQTL